MIQYKKMVHKLNWVFLLFFIFAGCFQPGIGALALLCMIPPLLTAPFYGRGWCKNYCPRGSFSDIILSRASLRRKAPGLLKNIAFRIAFMLFFMAVFIIQLLLSKLTLTGVGAVFVRMVAATTLFSVILGILFYYRAWCMICPMGTLAQLITDSSLVGRKRKRG